MSPSVSSSYTSPTPSASNQEKKTRSREGCFECRRKKRKCDIAYPRCGACCRVNSSCTYPPRQLDPVTGQLVTIKQPNQRKRPRPPDMTEPPLELHPFDPVDVLPEQPSMITPSFLPLLAPDPPSGPSLAPPLDVAFFSNIHDHNDLFSLFAEPSQQADIPWSYPSFAMPVDTSNNILLDLGMTLSAAYVDPNDLVSSAPVKASSASIPPMPDFFEMLQKRQPDMETLREMRVFWAELLHFYANLNDNYYYSVSIANRRKIFQSLVSENLSDVHLAASAYLCAARRVLLFELEGSNDKAAEWNARAQRYHKAAKDMLGNSTYSLCSRVGAGIDLRLGYILQDKLEEAIAIHEMTRGIIRDNLGAQPIWYLTDRIENSTISFSTFITTDVLHSVARPDCKTAFDVRVADQVQRDDPGLRIHLGIPAAILSAIAQIINLSGDPALRTSTGTAMVTEIENSLRDWKPEIRAGMTSSCLAETVAMQGMWCEVARILMYQFIHDHGILSLPIRAALTEFLRTANTIPDAVNEEESRLFVRASRACAWFIASTCAILPQERAECLKGLNGCGNEKAFKGNAEAARMLWKEMDEKGRPPDDWRVFLQERKVNVVFL